VRGQDFEKAGNLRDREMELKAKISAIVAGAKETSKAEAESVEGGGPTVTEADIANIVAQWTGIPIEKVSADETERLIKVRRGVGIGGWGLGGLVASGGGSAPC